MAWFKVDDAWWRHRKTRRLGRTRVRTTMKVAGAGVWTLTGDWAADNLTDGFVPWEIVEEWDPGREVAGQLIAVDFWYETERDGESGVQFHDWEEWQPTKAQVEATRDYNARKSALYRDPDLLETVRKRDRGRCRYCGELVNWRDRRSAGGGTYDHVDPCGPNSADNLVVSCRRCNSRKGNRALAVAGMTLLAPGSIGTNTGANQDDTQDVPSSYLDTDQNDPGLFQDPVPARPDPGSSDEEPVSASRRKSATKLPDTWRPTDRHRKYCADHGLDCDFQAEQFRSHAGSVDRRLSNWDQGFRNWLGVAVERGAKQANRSAQHQATGTTGGGQVYRGPWRNPADDSVYDQEF